MKASISFPELQSILREKAEQNISFGFVDGKTITVNIIFQPDNTTGLSGVTKSDIDDGKCYDLKGHPYRQGSRGLYIQHGKKYVNP